MKEAVQAARVRCSHLTRMILSSKQYANIEQLHVDPPLWALAHVAGFFEFNVLDILGADKPHLVELAPDESVFTNPR